jgi:hypothetical protein
LNGSTHFEQHDPLGQRTVAEQRKVSQCNEVAPQNPHLKNIPELVAKINTVEVKTKQGLRKQILNLL